MICMVVVEAVLYADTRRTITTENLKASNTGDPRLIGGHVVSTGKYLPTFRPNVLRQCAHFQSKAVV
jgi:hypothetical protein